MRRAKSESDAYRSLGVSWCWRIAGCLWCEARHEVEYESRLSRTPSPAQSRPRRSSGPFAVFSGRWQSSPVWRRGRSSVVNECTPVDSTAPNICIKSWKPATLYRNQLTTPQGGANPHICRKQTQFTVEGCRIFFKFQQQLPGEKCFQQATIMQFKMASKTATMFLILQNIVIKIWFSYTITGSKDLKTKLSNSNFL